MPFVCLHLRSLWILKDLGQERGGIVEKTGTMISHWQIPSRSTACWAMFILYKHGGKALEPVGAQNPRDIYIKGIYLFIQTSIAMVWYVARGSSTCVPHQNAT